MPLTVTGVAPSVYVMLQGAVMRQEVGGLVEQILQAQQGADALVERIFVGNHAKDRTGSRKMLGF